jgi:type I restriction-modification system DNA methylase subunit
MKQQLAEAQKALDLLQRDLSLQQDTYISNPDHAHDTAGKAKLDAMLQQIAGNQQTVDALKAQLAALLASASSKAPAPTPAAPPQL